MTRITLKAHAKINFNLKITGRRPDGYHLIESVVQAIDLHDTLTLEPSAAEGILLEVDDRMDSLGQARPADREGESGKYGAPAAARHHGVSERSRRRG